MHVARSSAFHVVLAMRTTLLTIAIVISAVSWIPRAAGAGEDLKGLTVRDNVEVWVAPAGARLVTNPVSDTEAAREMGKFLFARHCDKCHGREGNGDGPLARERKRLGEERHPEDLTHPDFQERVTDGEIFWKISTGLRRNDDELMPAFGTKVATQRLWALVHYVRSLRKNPGR